MTNVLLIQDDQHHAGLLSCAGHPDVRTPNIDRIAADGVRFSNAFCPSAICQASRVAMLTGLSCHTTGDYENSGQIRPDLQSLVGVLAARGYQTALIGKGHFVPQWPGHGFQVFRNGDFCDCKTHRDENEHFVRLKQAGIPAYLDEDLTCGEFAARPSALPLELTQEKWVADTAGEMLERRDPDRPFFYHVSFSRPHNPWTPSAPFDVMYDPASLTLPPTHPDDWKQKPFRHRDRWLDPKLVFHYPRMTPDRLRRALALYYGLISQVDQSIGAILDRLEALDLARNTVVVFCSDHGDFAGEHGILDKGVPTLDGIWRTPLILRAPGAAFPRGESRSQLVNLIDLLPTIFDLAGVPVPPQLEGRSLARELGEPEWAGREAVFFEYRHVKTVRTRDFALSYYSPGEEQHRDYAHSSTWAQGGELYDLRSDPQQFHNRYGDPAYLPVRLRLTELLLEWFCNTERVHRIGIPPYRRPHGLV
jgi:arylsulfatase A-like enzyme